MTPSPRANRATTGRVRGLLRRVWRWTLMALGLLIILAGGLVSPLPGPAGLPLVLVGLVVILRSSYKAKRLFVRLQRAHPRLLSPLRRLLGRDPKVVAVLWQQSLRVEKLVVPRRWRFAVRVRRRFFHKR